MYKTDPQHAKEHLKLLLNHARDTIRHDTGEPMET